MQPPSRSDVETRGLPAPRPERRDPIAYTHRQYALFIDHDLYALYVCATHAARAVPQCKTIRMIMLSCQSAIQSERLRCEGPAMSIDASRAQASPAPSAEGSRCLKGAHTSSPTSSAGSLEDTRRRGGNDAAPFESVCRFSRQPFAWVQGPRHASSTSLGQ